MVRVDPVWFAYECKSAELLDKRLSVEQLCKEFNNIAGKFKVNGTNLPPAGGCATLQFDHGALTRQPAVAALSKPMEKQSTATIVVAVAGESHDDKDDLKRAEDLIREFFAMRTKTHALLYLERGLKKKHGRLLVQAIVDANRFIVADEVEMWQQEGHEANRSVMIAAYCVTCLAGGNQQKKGKVLILIGNNHVDDVVKALKILMETDPPYPWLRNRPRAIHTLSTLAKV